MGKSRPITSRVELTGDLCRSRGLPSIVSRDSVAGPAAERRATLEPRVSSPYFLSNSFSTSRKCPLNSAGFSSIGKWPTPSMMTALKSAYFLLTSGAVGVKN